MELSNAELEMVGNNFVGNGTIAVGRGSAVTSLEKTKIISNTFHGVQLRFKGKKTKNNIITLRNNDLKNGSKFTAPPGSFNRCDPGSANTGQAAGCDPRAECTEPQDKGNVQCKCVAPLRFKDGFRKDGSKCALVGELLDIFREQRTIMARVRKPLSLQHLFSIEAQSEVSFNATISSNASYLVIDSLPVLPPCDKMLLLGPCSSTRLCRARSTVLGQRGR